MINTGINYAYVEDGTKSYIFGGSVRDTGLYNGTTVYSRFDSAEYTHNNYVALESVSGVTPNGSTQWALLIAVNGPAAFGTGSAIDIEAREAAQTAQMVAQQAYLASLQPFNTITMRDQITNGTVVFEVQDGGLVRV